jgi:hypothetical protein
LLYLLLGSWLLHGSLGLLRVFVLASRLWCFLLVRSGCLLRALLLVALVLRLCLGCRTVMLGRCLLRLTLLRLGCRASALRGRLGSGLLRRRWLDGTLQILLRGASWVRHHFWRGRGCSLRGLRLNVLPHYSVLRLVAVVLALERLLLFRVRIASA